MTAEQGPRERVAVVYGTPPVDTDHLERAACEFGVVSLYGENGSAGGLVTDGNGVTWIGVELLLAPKRSGHQHWVYHRLGAVLDVVAPSLVHVVGEPCGVRALQVAGWCRRRGTGVRMVVHGCDRQWFHGAGPERLAKRLTTRFVLGGASAFVAETLDAARQVERFSWGRDMRVAAVHTNPRDASVFRPPTDRNEQSTARLELGLPAEGGGVVFLGRMVVEKGPFLFLEAAAEARARGLSAWFAMAGGGPLAREVEKRCGSENVKFVGEQPYPFGVAKLLRAADVIVVPSLTTAEVSEQGPRVVIEAMLSGRTVVASSSGALPEMVGDVGLVFQEARSQDLVEGITRAVDMRVGASTPWDVRARQRADRLYSTEAVAGQMTSLWHDVLASPAIRDAPNGFQPGWAGNKTGRK